MRKLIRALSLFSSSGLLALSFQGCTHEEAIPTADQRGQEPVSAQTSGLWQPTNWPVEQVAKDIGAGGTSYLDVAVVGTPNSGVYGYAGYAFTGGQGQEVWSRRDGAGYRIDVTATGRKVVIGYLSRLYIGNWGTWSLPIPNPAGEPSGLSDVGVGGGADVIWALGTTPYPQSTSTTRRIYRLGSQSWQLMTGLGKRIDVDPAGQAWVIGSDDRLWWYNPDGIDDWDPMGSLTALDIGVNPIAGQVYAVEKGTGLVHKWWDGFWIPDSFGMTGERITVGANGRPWVIRANGSVWEKVY